MEKIDFEKIKHALPSKKFAKVFIIGLGIVIIVLVAGSHFGSNGTFSRNGGLAESNTTMGQAVTQDSNNNGILDWEETLWGLDPKGDGATNKKLIDERKAANGIDTTSEDTPLTPTDEFSRNLFATIMTLQESGSLTPEAITNLAGSIGDSVDAKHATAETYTLDQMAVVPPSSASKTAYKTALKALIADYSGVDLGSELDIIGSGLGSGGATALKKLEPMQHAYATLSKKILQLPTPSDIAPTALALANAEAEMSVTLPQVEQIYTDALTGMVGLDDFVKANQASDDASAKIKTYFGV